MALFRIRKTGKAPAPTEPPQFAPPVEGEDISAMLSRIEQEENIPTGRLTALAKTESSLNPTARNPKSTATGLFQFTKPTGQDVGLMGEGFDDRTDPEKSARAAAQMLKRNTQALGGDWDAGIQAHHTGLGGVQKFGGPDPENPESVGYLDAYRKNYQPPETPPPAAKPGRKRLSKEEAAAYLSSINNVPVSPGEDTGWWENAARGAGERGVSLFGDFLGAVGQAGEAVSNITGTFTTGGEYLTPAEVRARKKAGAKNVLGIAGEEVKGAADFGYEEKTSWEDFKTAYDEGGLAWVDDMLLYGGEQGIKSIPDMIAAVGNMPGYVMTRAHEIGGDRARNKGKEQQTLGDTWEALPFATASALLERVGAKGIAQAAIPEKIVEEVGKAGIKNAILRGAKDIGKAGGKELSTEALQEGVLEYLGEKAGTGAKLSLAEAIDRAAAGAVAGGTFGTGAATPGTVIRELRRPVTKDITSQVSDLKITPAAEAQVAEEDAAATAEEAAAKPVKAEINEQDISDNIEIASQVMATGDEARTQKLSDDLTEAYGPHTAKAILQRAGEQVTKKPQPEAVPEPTPAPAVPLTPEEGVQAEPAKVAEQIVTTDDKPALTPAAAAMSSALNEILGREHALRGNQELGEARGALDERITEADDFLSALALNLPAMSREGYRTQPVWDVIRQMPGARISKRGRASKEAEMVDRTGKTGQPKFLGKEVAKLGEALRRAQYRADGTSRGVITHGRLGKLLDDLVEAYDGVLNQGPVGAPKRVREAVGGPPVRTAETIEPAKPTRGQQIKEKEAARKAKVVEEVIEEPTPTEVTEGQRRRMLEEKKREQSRAKFESDRRKQIEKAHKVKAEEVAKPKKKKKVVLPKVTVPAKPAEKRAPGTLGLRKTDVPTEERAVVDGSQNLKVRWIASGMDITEKTDKQLEEDHSWVQSTFPNGKPSAAQPNTEWMNREQAREVKRLRPGLEKEMDANADRVAKFLDDNPALTKPGNHNAKRVSRILESLSMFGFNELAQDYANNFKDIYQAHGNLTPALRERWDNIVRMAEPVEDAETERKLDKLDELELDTRREEGQPTVQDRVDNLTEQSEKISTEDAAFDAKFNAATKQMQKDFAEYGKEGDRLVFFVHATDRILGDTVAIDPRTGRPDNSTDNRPYFYTTMDPKDARDYATHHGIANPAVIVYGIPKSRVDELEANQNIKYSQNSWSIGGRKFTEFKLTDYALVEIEDARRIADNARDVAESVDEADRDNVKEGRERTATLLDQALSQGEAGSDSLVQMLINNLDVNDPYVGVLSAIQAKGIGNIEVIPVDSDMMVHALGTNANGAYQQGRNKRTKVDVRRILINDRILDQPYSIKTFTHEMVHAATMAGMRTDNPTALRIAALRRYVIKSLEDRPRIQRDVLSGQYGLTNADEFVAEAMSNASFQRFLARIPAPEGKSAWTALVEIVRKFLGMDVSSESVLSNVMALIEEIMLSEADIKAGVNAVRAGDAQYITEAEASVDDTADLEAMAAAGTLFDKTPMERRKRQQALEDNAEYVRTAMQVDDSLGGATEGATQAFNTPAKSAVDRVKDQLPPVANPIVLGTMTGDAIDSYAREDFKHEVDGEQLDPLGDYSKAMLREQAESRTLDREAEALNATWTKVLKKHSEYKETFDNIVLQSTMYQVDPSVAWVHPANSVTRGNKQRGKTAQEAHRRLRLQYLSMPAPMQNLYKSAAGFYRDTYLKMREQIIDNILDMYDVKASPRLRAAVINSRTADDLDAIVPPMVTRKVGGQPVRVPLPSWDKAVKVFKDMDQVMNNNGPYFPQMRFGDHAIEYSKKKTSRVYSSKTAAENASRAFRANNPGAKTKSPEKDAGGWTFDSIETGFSLYESKPEALAAQAELIQEGFDVSGVSKKADITFGEDSTASRIMSVANNKLKGPGAERSKQALHEALVTMLPETSMQKRMLKRKNIRGASMDSQRVFANYAQAAGHHLAKLKYRKDVETSFNQIMSAPKNIARQGIGSTEQAQKVGNVANEIQKRHNKVDKAGGLSRVAAKLGFLGYLFSLSYSAVNATQPLLMTIPYLSGKYGGAKASVALASAYKQVGGKVAASAAKNIGGAKGLIPGQTIDLNELTNNIIDGLRESNPQAAKMLNELADLGTLDATFALEISEMAKSKGGVLGKITDKAVEVGRVLPYTIEIMNRATTAVAAYDLAVDSGVSHETAVEQAREAIVKTQFDYTMQNRPRYFKANELAKVMTMFKIHPLGVYSFLVTQTRALARTPQERKEAARSLRWFLYTHAAFAGVAGSLLMEPIRATLGLVDLLFGDDDEDDWLSNPDLNMRNMVYNNLVGLTDHETAAKAAEVFVHGLPRAAGFDMASRVGVENLMVMWQEGDNLWESMGSSFEKTLVGPVFGASDGISRGIAHAANGGGLAKSLEYMAPKGIRDFMRSYRYATEGMTDFNGNVILDSENFSNVELAAKAFGFSTSTEAETFEKRAIVKKATTRVENERRALIREYVNADRKDKDAVRADIREFNANLPPDLKRAKRIKGGDLVKSRASRRERERRTKEGVYLPKEQRRVRKRLESFE